MPLLHPVVFVGAGPGPADLLTLRGARHLAQAEVVLFDALTEVEGFRALAPGARWIDVGKRGFSGKPGCDASGQARINHLLVEQARAGHRVLRLKGGDPSLFGRLEEELGALAAAGLQAEVVPGVTAALAAAAALQRPLTRRGRGRSVALTTAVSAVGSSMPGALSAMAFPMSSAESGVASQVPPAASTAVAAEVWPPQGELRSLSAAPRPDTEVFYMAGKQLAALGRRLREAGWPASSPVAVVSRAGCADQLASVHQLEGLGAAALLHAGRPTVVTVGVGAEALSPAPAAAFPAPSPRAADQPA